MGRVLPKTGASKLHVRKTNGGFLAGSLPAARASNPIAYMKVRTPSSRLVARGCGIASRCAASVRAATGRGVASAHSEEPLMLLSAAVVGFPGEAATTSALDFAVMPAVAGGHALLGRTGHGKTLLAQALAHGEPPPLPKHQAADHDSWLREGQFERRGVWSAQAVSQVSFESHERLLDEGGTVYQALCTRAHLSAAAKFLIVRFGLYHLLYRPVSAISTGEIRKVLLARALSTRPRLLILDNAFDGLDVDSRRALAELISTTLRGFSPLLVQGVDSSAT